MAPVLSPPYRSVATDIWEVGYAAIFANNTFEIDGPVHTPSW